MFGMPMGAVSAHQIIVARLANGFIGPMVNLSASITICNLIGNTATINGSYMYPKKNGPHYIGGGAGVSGIRFL